MIPGTNCVIDLSHHNGNKLNLAKAKAAGIAAVIHKATQGTTFQDPCFATNRKKALDAGLLFGAYHYGTGDDASEQSDFFLNMAQPAPGILLALDWEENPQGPDMTLTQARTFVSDVAAANARFPGLYSGHVLKEALGDADDPILTRCWLWLAQYGQKPVIPCAWERWTLWQYTDGCVGPDPHTVAGIGACDRDTFNGTAAELQQFWKPAPFAPLPTTAV